jgi:hypothetical protein
MVCYQGRMLCQQKIAALSSNLDGNTKEQKLQEARKLESNCRSLLQTIQDSDWPPTSMMEKAVGELEESLKRLK